MWASRSLGHVFFSGFWSFPDLCIPCASSSHLSPSPLGLPRWYHHYLHLSVFTASPPRQVAWQAWEVGVYIEKEDKPWSCVSFSAVSLAWLPSQPPSWSPCGNGVLTVPFQVYHIIMKSSLLILALPLVASPYVRGIQCTTKICCISSLRKRISLLHA